MAKGGIVHSTDNGTSWAEIDSDLTNNVVHVLAMTGNNLLAGTSTNLLGSTYPGGRIFLSTNDGGSWTIVNTGLTSADINVFNVNGGNLFAGTEGGGVLLSTNNGISWTTVNSGITFGAAVHAIVVADSNLYIGTEIGVWYRPLSDITSVHETFEEKFPRAFLLSQNYPEPFNPSTTIEYQIPINTFVSLEVYDALGRKVRTLVNERQSAGTHSVTFSASNLSSGVYFYRLSAGNFVQTKKLMLIK